MINTVEKIYYMGSSNTFKVTHTNNEVVFVPLYEANSDYQAIQEWAAIEGNTITDNPPE